MIVLKINNPQPNKKLVKGSEINVRLINSSPNLALDIPKELQYVVDVVNTTFNIYALSSASILPVLLRVRTKEYTELPAKLNPLVFYDLTLIVMEDVLTMEDFAKDVLFIGMFFS